MQTRDAYDDATLSSTRYESSGYFHHCLEMQLANTRTFRYLHMIRSRIHFNTFFLFFVNNVIHSSYNYRDFKLDGVTPDEGNLETFYLSYFGNGSLTRLR